MDMLASTVRERTEINDGYRQHAAHQSMEAYLNDWQAAHERLGRQIEELRDMWKRRLADAESGLWPPLDGRLSRPVVGAPERPGGEA